ncbi:MAG: EamA family transporter [Candidatus Omnitrophica bacterium]|nr:EamA family transporter [Candidatus Omnitrophota bacterium]
MKPSIFLIISLIVLTSICDTISQLFLKSAINSLEANINSIKKVFAFIIRLILVRRIWIGLIFSCLSLFVWLFVLSKADLNLAFSIDSMHYIFIAFASSLILKERVGLKRWLGTVLIVVGIALVTLSGL